MLKFKEREETHYIVVHCSATPKDMEIGVREIRQWHITRGWVDVGYHLIIRRNGVVELGRPFNAVGAHVKGFNDVSVSVCLVGGKTADDTYTDEQMRSLESALKVLQNVYPGAVVMGHNEFPNVSKACPRLDVQELCEEWNLKSSNHLAGVLINNTQEAGVEIPG